MGDRIASDPRRAVLDAFDLGRKEVHRREADESNDKQVSGA
jgi:hypothetical protein